jgi:hypothetical protein
MDITEDDEDTDATDAADDEAAAPTGTAGNGAAATIDS